VKLLAKFSRVFVPVRARSWLLRGLLEEQSGRPDRARRFFQRAASVAESLETPFERGRALLELSRLDGANAAAHRAEAHRLFGSCAAPYWASLAA
jgi:hypothetical protein